MRKWGKRSEVKWVRGTCKKVKVEVREEGKVECGERVSEGKGDRWGEWGGKGL